MVDWVLLGSSWGMNTILIFILLGEMRDELLDQFFSVFEAGEVIAPATQSGFEASVLACLSQVSPTPLLNRRSEEQKFKRTASAEHSLLRFYVPTSCSLNDLSLRRMQVQVASSNSDFRPISHRFIKSKDRSPILGCQHRKNTAFHHKLCYHTIGIEPKDNRHVVGKRLEGSGRVDSEDFTNEVSVALACMCIMPLPP